MLQQLFAFFSAPANFNLTILSGAVVGLAAGYIGSFLVLRKMALTGDALTHVALPGMGLAALFGLNIFFGAWVFLMFAVAGMWWIERKTTLTLETLAGIFFTTSLAVGILLIPQVELMEALFGDIEKLTVFNGLLAIGVGILSAVLLIILTRRLMLFVISEDLARTSGINVSRLDLVFLLLLGVIVALGVHVTGALLMGALVIIPAASAKNFTRSFSGYVWGSAGLGALAMLIALPMAHIWHITPGPMVVLVLAAFFIISFLFYRWKK